MFMDKRRIVTYLLLLLSMLFWSFSYIWVKTVYQYIGPLSTVFIRLVIASVFLIGLSLMLGKLQRIHKKDTALFLLLAFFEPFLYFLGESYGISLVSPTVAAIIISTIPLFVPVSMFVLNKEPLRSNNFLAIFISFIGVLMVVLNHEFKLAASPRGIALMGLAVFSVMGYSYLLQKLSVRYNAYTIISAQNFIGIFYFLPLVLIFDLKSLTDFPMNTELVVHLLLLAVFASALAFFFFTIGTQRIGISKATMFTYMIPVLTAIFSYIINGEEFSRMKIGGILLVISGLVFAKFSPMLRKKS